MKIKNTQIIDNKSHETITKKWFLLIPFFLLIVILVLLPLLLILIKSFEPAKGYTINDNWEILNSGYIWSKIFISLFDAIVVTIICLILGYGFAYFLSLCKNNIFKTMIMLIIVAPIWTSFLVKLIGLKTFFDLMNGINNSTFGNIYTIIGLVYLFLPFMIMPIYTALKDMPQNIILASQDLGSSQIRTFYKIIVPYTRVAIISGITLVFLPSLTTVAVPQFLNNNTDNASISDIIVDIGSKATTSQLFLANASVLSLVLSLVILVAYIIFRTIYKFGFKKRRLKKNG